MLHPRERLSPPPPKQRPPLVWYVDAHGHAVRCSGKPRARTRIHTYPTLKLVYVELWREVVGCVDAIEPTVLAPEE